MTFGCRSQVPLYGILVPPEGGTEDLKYTTTNSAGGFQRTATSTSLRCNSPNHSPSFHRERGGRGVSQADPSAQKTGLRMTSLDLPVGDRLLQRFVRNRMCGSGDPLLRRFVCNPMCGSETRYYSGSRFISALTPYSLLLSPFFPSLPSHHQTRSRFRTRSCNTCTDNTCNNPRRPHEDRSCSGRCRGSSRRRCR